VKPGRVRRLLTVAAVVGLGATGLVMVASAEGTPPVEVMLQDGAAWLASPGAGQLTLIDGRSAEVAARVAVGASSDELTAVQSGPAGYAVDGQRGTVVRVDPTTLTAGEPVTVIDGASGGVAGFAADDALYILDQERGRIAVTDPEKVDRLRGRPASVAEPVRSSIVDGGGRLWLLGESSGDLTWFDGVERGSRPEVTDQPGQAELAVVDGRAALVDRQERTVVPLDGGGGRSDGACIDMDPRDETVRMAGSPASPRLYTVSGADGVLRVSDLDAGQCDELAVTVADPDHDLGQPRESAGRIFVPDYTTGRVAVVDPVRRSVVTTGELVEPGGLFELFPEDGIVFYNDPASERAGVVDVDGTFTPVAKFDPDDPTAGLTTGADAAPTDTPGPDAPAAASPSGTEAVGAAGRGADAPDSGTGADAPDSGTGGDAEPPDGEPPSGAPSGATPPSTVPSGRGTTSTASTSSSTSSSTTSSSSTSTSTTSTSTTSTSTTSTTAVQPRPPIVTNTSANAAQYLPGDTVTVTATVSGDFDFCSVEVPGMGVNTTCSPGSGGPGAVGVSASFPAGGPGNYTANVMVSGTAGQAQGSAPVSVIDDTDTSPPSVQMNGGSSFTSTGPATAHLTVSASSADPESGVAVTALYGTLSWRCQNPFQTGNGQTTSMGEFGRNTLDYVTGNFSAEFACDSGQTYIAGSGSASVWAVATNGEGLQATSGTITVNVS
jgi:hypothetical protein